MKLMASESMGAADRYLILSLFTPALAGMVSRNSSSLMGLSSIRWMAGPERMPWEAQA